MLNLRSAAPFVAPDGVEPSLFSSVMVIVTNIRRSSTAAAAETQVFHNEAQKCSTATTTENTSRRQTDEGFSPQRQTVYTGGRRASEMPHERDGNDFVKKGMMGKSLFVRLQH